MAQQVDKLVKVGLEGFALLDACRRKKPAGSKVPTTTNPQKYVYWGLQVITVKQPVIDSDQAAQIYGGISVVDHSMSKPARGVY